jgi:hypothetical protein
MKVEERQKFLLILTIAVVALYVGNLLIFEPMGRLWKSRSDTIKELRNDVKEGKFLLARESAIRSQWEKMNTNTGQRRDGHGHHAAMEERLDELHDAQLPRGRVRRFEDFEQFCL